jgi:hypothetical protein
MSLAELRYNTIQYHKYHTIGALECRIFILSPSLTGEREREREREMGGYYSIVCGTERYYVYVLEQRPTPTKTKT